VCGVTRIRRRTFALVASLLAVLLAGLIVVAYATRLGHERARVPNATPLWNGDTFTIRKIDSDLPPYQFSSASGPTAGWLQPNSNTNPNVDGVAVVPDPTGLRSSAHPGVRKVIKITTDDGRAFNGRYVRTELRGPEIFRPGNYRWVIQPARHLLVGLVDLRITVPRPEPSRDSPCPQLRRHWERHRLAAAERDYHLANASDAKRLAYHRTPGQVQHESKDRLERGLVLATSA
jgi:hypothetical protein